MQPLVICTLTHGFMLAYSKFVTSWRLECMMRYLCLLLPLVLTTVICIHTIPTAMLNTLVVGPTRPGSGANQEMLATRLG